MAGLWFDELAAGQTFTHAITRTVTETDNLLFSALTHNSALLHLDAEYAGCRRRSASGPSAAPWHYGRHFHYRDGAGTVSLHGNMLDLPHLVRAQRSIESARLFPAA